MTPPGVGVAIELDGALVDTRPLWDAWLSAADAVLGLDGRGLPGDRGEAARELDDRGAGNWRTLLQRFSEERAAVYLHRDSATSVALRSLESAHRSIGVFTDAPEPLARVALAQLGADRRVDSLETGAGALDRLLATLGADAVVIRTREELLALARDTS